MRDMNAKVHPLVVVLVMLLTFLAIGVWMWGTGEAKEFGGPAQLSMDPEGHLYVQIQNQLLEHDESGVFLVRHDLEKLGVESMLGGFGFFSDGDILLRRGSDPRTVLDNIRAYQRRTNEQSLIPGSPNTGLYRCNLETTNCEIFGSNGIDLKAAHSIFIDWRTDEVYIADTTRHLLRKYSAKGEELAGPIGGFKFPNQLLMRGEQLFVANTNYHQIRIVDPNTASFGEELGVIDVVPDAAATALQTWPSHLARVGDEWWVNNMRNGMNEGGIYVFDDSWRYDRKVPLPPNADPISLLSFGDEVLISDWNNDRVYRVSLSGEMLMDFASPGLEQVLAGFRTPRLQYKIYSYSGIALFVLVIVGLFVRGLTTTTPPEPAKKTAATVTEKFSASDETIWLEPEAKTVVKFNLAMRLAALLMIVLTVSLVFVVVLYGDIRIGAQLLLPICGLVAIFVLIARTGRVNAGTAIGLRGEKITLRDHTGRDSTCRIEDAIYDHTAIATQDMAVFLGQPQMSIYNQEVLKEKLFPRLAEAQRVSVWEMQKTLIRIRHPQGLITLLTILGIAAGSVWMLVRPTV